MDGNCGIDAMCLILGWSRTVENRNTIRCALVDLCAKHSGNRALIAMLASCGELSTSLGYHDLNTSGRELVQHHCHGNVEETSHCHGGDLAVPNDHPLEVAVPGQVSFSDEQIAAITWKCRMHDVPRAGISKVLERLGDKVSARTVDEYKAAAAAGPLQPKKKPPVFILCRDRAESVRDETLKYLFNWCSEEYGTATVAEMRSTASIPRGTFVAFTRAHVNLMKHCTEHGIFSSQNHSYKNNLRLYMTAIRSYLERNPSVTDDLKQPSQSLVESQSAVAELPNVDSNPLVKYKNIHRRPMQYNPHAANIVCDSKRRRAVGAGRPRTCMAFREAYTLWWSIIRHSINMKIMCRVPKSFLLMRAKLMQREYYIICIQAGEDPEHVHINMEWVDGWLFEHRLNHRMPNRKFKVARWVLAERLVIWWINVHVVRTLIILFFGYDPDFRNVDQSPFPQKRGW